MNESELLSKRGGKATSKNDGLIYELLADSKYDVRECGEIYKLIIGGKARNYQSTWKKLGTVRATGYIEVHYKGKKLNGHRIIYAKFGKLPLSPSLVINHIDSNTSNNHIDNLELITRSENNIHAQKAGRKPYIGRKINLEIAQRIRKLRKEGFSCKWLMNEYELALTTVRDILNYKTWKNA